MGAGLTSMNEACLGEVGDDAGLAGPATRSLRASVLDAQRAADRTDAIGLAQLAMGSREELGDAIAMLTRFAPSFRLLAHWFDLVSK